MASEIRVNQIQNRSGLSTVTFSDSGVIISGITTISDLRTSGTSVVAAGTTAAPSISPTGDSNTGIFFPSADTIAFAEGGVEAARFDSSGRLGIGTVNPAEQLELFAGSERLMIGANSPSTYSRIAARNVTNTGYRGFQIDGSDLLINSNTSGNITLGVGGGSVGINTANPPDKLTVLGKVHVQQDATSSNRIIFRGTPSSSYRWNIDNFGASNLFRIYREDDATSASGAVAIEINASTRNVSLYGGNLAFDSGKGIDFSATANSSGTMTSELFADYEEGTWTPVDNSGASLTLGANTKGHYVRVGNVVNLFGRVVFPSTGSGSAANIGGLPFSGYYPPSADVSNGSVPNGFGYISGGSIIPQIHMSGGAAVINFYNFATQMTNANFSGIEIRFGVTYRTS